MGREEFLSEKKRLGGYLPYIKFILDTVPKKRGVCRHSNGEYDPNSLFFFFVVFFLFFVCFCVLFCRFGLG